MEPQKQVTSEQVAKPTLQEPKKCKHMPVIVILVVLLVGSCIFGGFELWQSMQKDSEIAKLKEAEQSQDIPVQGSNEENTLVDGSALSVDEAETILEKYIGDGSSTVAFGLNVYYNTFNSDFNDQQKVSLAYNSIDRDNREKISCISEKYGDADCTGEGISYSMLNEKYLSLFGDYSSLEKKDYTLYGGAMNLVYDESIDAYREYTLPVGGWSPVVAAHKVISVEKIGDNMVASMVFAELNTDIELASGVCGPTSLSGGLGVTEETVDDMANSMAIYEFTLSPYNDTYVLTSIAKEE